MLGASRGFLSGTLAAQLTERSNAQPTSFQSFLPINQSDITTSIAFKSLNLPIDFHLSRIEAEVSLSANLFTMGDDLVIYYNDSIDSDNLAAAMALFKATYWKPTVRVLWILEPRQVCFGLSMTMDQITRCKELIKQHFPSFENPFKTLLNGDIKQQDIDDIKDLTKDDRKIVSFPLRIRYYRQI